MITPMTGASTNGGASLPFITTGAPKSSGSLMLKMAGTIPALPTSRSCLLFAKSSSSAKARVVPDPPCQTNQMKNSCVNTCGGGWPALAAAMFSASAASQRGRTAARRKQGGAPPRDPGDAVDAPQPQCAVDQHHHHHCRQRIAAVDQGAHDG